MTCDPDSVLYSFKLAKENDQNVIHCCKLKLKLKLTLIKTCNYITKQSPVLNNRYRADLSLEHSGKLGFLLQMFGCTILK